MGIIVTKVTFRKGEIPLSQAKRKDLRMARENINLCKGAISGFTFSKTSKLKKHVLLIFLSSHPSALTNSKDLNLCFVINDQLIKQL